jgi:hypothetical protein
MARSSFRESARGAILQIFNLYPPLTRHRDRKSPSRLGDAIHDALLRSPVEPVPGSQIR